MRSHTALSCAQVLVYEALSDLEERDQVLVYEALSCAQVLVYEAYIYIMYIYKYIYSSEISKLYITYLYVFFSAHTHTHTHALKTPSSYARARQHICSSHNSYYIMLQYTGIG